MTFAPLDAEKIKEDLQLEKQGRSRGATNSPPSDATSLDDVESRLIHYVGVARAEAADKLEAGVATYEERIAALDLSAATSKIDSEALDVLSEFRTQLSTGADLVYLERKSVVAIETEIERFKRKNGLDRLAHYPESKTLLLAILGVILLLEAVLNGFFLGETHTLGLLGGVSEALIIAVVNVALGWLVGRRALPEVNHVNGTRKLVGLLLLLLYLPASLGFNLGVAHYRDALSAGHWDEATTLALTTLVAEPLGVDDIKSWLLFLLGLLFSGIALVDGFSFDDRYPGYGVKDRKRREVLDHYRDVKEECLDELREIKTQAVATMQQVKDDLISRRSELGSILAGRRRFFLAFEEHLSLLEQVGNDLLTTYREANRRARTSPAPPHFSQRWQLDRRSPSVFVEVDVAKIEQAIELTGATLDRRIAEVHKAFDIAVEAFRRIDQLTQEELTRGSAQAIVQAAA